MYILRLGIISSLLSETLVSGFTTGAAMHVLTSQVKDLLGIKLTGKSEFFVVIKVRQVCSHEWIQKKLIFFLCMFLLDLRRNFPENVLRWEFELGRYHNLGYDHFSFSFEQYSQTKIV